MSTFFLVYYIYSTKSRISINFQREVFLTSCRCSKSADSDACSDDYEIKSQRNPTSQPPQHHLQCSPVFLYQTSLILRLCNRIARGSQMSDSECSLLEEPMQGRHPFYKGFAIRQRVRRSTGLVHRELAIRYILVPDETFYLIVYPG